MDAVRSNVFSDVVVLSRHNYHELESLAVSAYEAADIWSFVWQIYCLSDDINLPVGFRNLLEIAHFKSDEVLQSIQLYQSCVASGRMFNPPL